MRPKTQRPQRLRQTTPPEVLDALCGLVQRKLYEGQAVEFAKDRNKLLEWALLWPAEWLKERGVDISNDDYQQTLSKIIIEAAAHGNTTKVTYRPAWLKTVIQSHFAIHGEEIYARAKAIRNLAEHTLLTLGKIAPKDQDSVVNVFSDACRLLRTKRAVAPKAVQKDQLSLF